MKKLNILTLLVVLLSFKVIHAQPDFSLSDGIYRIPYADGTEVHISNDHLDHDPQGRIDMSGTGPGSGPYQIVAAADGWVRAIVDDNPLTATDCADNNYVWMEHLNGEWTKYSHMETNSTIDDAGLEEDDYVSEGTFLGYENSVGCATGDHLHFEVAVSLTGDDLVFAVDGGHIDGDFAVNRIPVFCDISLNYFVSGSDYTADDCGSTSCSGTTTFSSLTKSFDQIEVTISSSTITGSSSVSFLNGSNALWQAEDYVKFSPGFTASSGTEFIGRIGECNETPGKLSADLQTENNVEANENLISILPNPNAGIFHLKYSLANTSDVRVIIKNSVGQVMFNSGEYKQINFLHETIDVSNHPKGIYFLEIHHDWGVEIEQILIQ
ncbi:MAG: peptidoglycan DD-metalloendopeptidase family protein [Fimbriimonadaceae bacterium]|nr:peptidoglycan DD-metalloendopeptidase family protein [Chitinophagales bacterium]